jgi:hypothetical protein
VISGKSILIFFANFFLNRFDSALLNLKLNANIVNVLITAYRAITR